MDRALTDGAARAQAAGTAARGRTRRLGWRSLAVAGALAACAGEVPDREARPQDTAVLRTAMGDIVIEFHSQRAPATVRNFRRYLGEGFYDGTIFHRVIPGFVVQGGGFTAGMRRKAGHAPIPNEASNGLRNERGAVSMARTGDPHSATSQFFINLADNPALDPSGANAGYAVFAQVVSDMDVVDAIAAAPTGSRLGHRDVPLEPVSIERAELR